MAQDVVKPLSDTAEACVVHAFGFCLSNKIDLALIVTVLIFVAGLWLTAQADRKREAKDRLKTEERELRVRRRYLLALREEIGLNIAGLEKSVASFPSRADLTAFLISDKAARPLITFGYYSVILRNRTEVLQDLPDTLIKNTIDFYGKLDQIALDCAAIESRSYVTISTPGRIDTMLDIHSQTRVALQQGLVMRDAITQHLTDGFGAPQI